MNNGQNKVVYCPHRFAYSESQETPTGLAGVGREWELQHCGGLSMAPPAPNCCCFPGVKLQHPQEQAEKFSRVGFFICQNPLCGCTLPGTQGKVPSPRHAGTGGG